jgi:hypothetical protein
MELGNEIRDMRVDGDTEPTDRIDIKRIKYYENLERLTGTRSQKQMWK